MFPKRCTYLYVEVGAPLRNPLGVTHDGEFRSFDLKNEQRKVSYKVGYLLPHFEEIVK